MTENQTESLERIEVVKRGFFQIVVTEGEIGAVTLDVSMLPDTIKELIAAAPVAVVDASDTEVDSAEMMEWAAAERKKVRDSGKFLEEYRLAVTRRIDAFKEAVMVPFRTPVQNFEHARKLYDQKLVEFETAEENRRKQEEAKAKAARDAEIKRQQEEADRVEREARQKLDQLRAQAEQQAVAGGELTELTQQAEQVRTEAAAKLQQISQSTNELQHATTVTSPPLARASGFSVVRRWKCRVTDLDAFLKAVVEGKIPKAFVDVDQKALDRQAALLKEDFNYPGCEVYQEKGGTTR